MRILVLAGLMVMNVGCVRSVADRGTGWWRVTTEHVEFETDVPRAQAVTAGWAFEDDYRALEHVFPRCDAPPIGDRVHVTMIARGNEYDALAPIQHTAGYFRPAVGGIVPSPPMIVVRGGSGIGQGYFTQIYIHELTHRFVARCFPDAATWLHEGMAKFFETMRVGSNLVIGDAPYRIEARVPYLNTFLAGGFEVTQVGRDQLLSPSQIASLPATDFYAAHVTEHYASAWALVHMLMLGPDSDLRTRFERYLAGMAAHGGDPAWFAESFDAAALDSAESAYVTHPLLERRVPYDPAALADPAADPLTSGEAHLLLETLISGRHNASDAEVIRDHLALAAQQASTLARARLAQLATNDFEGPPGSDAAHLAQLAAEFPTDIDVLSTRAQFEIDRRASTNEGRMLIATLGVRDDLRGLDLARLATLASVHGMQTLALTLARRGALLAPSTSETHRALSLALWQNSYGTDSYREHRLAVITAGHGAPEQEPPARRAWSDVEAEPTPGPAPTAISLPAEPDASGALLVLTSDAVALRRATTLDPTCIGFVGDPTAVIDLPEGAPPLVLRTLGSFDSVLVVVDSDHHVVCDDDSGGDHRAAVYGAFPPGPLVVYAGTFNPSATPVHQEVHVERGDQPIHLATVSRACQLLANVGYGSLAVGTRVVLGRHAELTPPSDVAVDPIRDTNWVPAMDAFVGRTARVIGLRPPDAARCPVVLVDVDGGAWVWRTRDLTAPPN